MILINGRKIIIMRYQKVVLLLLVLALLPCVLGAVNEVNLEVTSLHDEYTFTETTNVITVTVTNSGNLTAYGVALSTTAQGLSISADPESADISAGGQASYTLTVSGQVCKTTFLDINAEGKDADGNIYDSSLGIMLHPPERGIEILYPKETLKLVDMQQGGTKGFEVLVKNSELKDVDGVSLSVKDMTKRMNCTIGTGSQTVPARSSASYSVTCVNVTTGSRATFQLMDSCGNSQDIDSVTFEVIERVKDYRLEIVSPAENDEVLATGNGTVVNVTASNIGRDDMTGVCVYAKNITYNKSSCVNLSSNQNHTFSLTIFPVKKFGGMDLIVNDSTGQAHDKIVVWVSVTPTVQPQVNNSKNNTQSADLNISQNLTSETGQQNDHVFGIPRELFILIVVLVPLLVLGAFIQKSLKRNKTK